MRGHRFLRAGEAWLLLLLVGAFFFRPLTTKTFFFRDIYLLFYPKKLFMAAALRAGELPLWDPLTSGGQPFLASPQSTLYYPLNLLFLVLPVIAAYNLLLVLQFAGCALGAWVLARTTGLSRTAAFVSAVIYAFAGYTLSTANLNTPLLALPWIPLTVALAHRALRDGRRAALAGAGVSAAMPLLGGAAEVTAILFVTLVAWVLSSGNPEGDRRRNLAAFLFIALAAIGVSLAQTVPALEMIRQSSRGPGLPYEVFTQWSVNPRRLPELVLPHFFGDTTNFASGHYWGRRFENVGFPYILSIYFGAACLALAAAGGSAGARRDELPRRTLLFLAGAGLLLSLGANLPGFRVLHAVVPFVDIFRYPVKALTLVLLPVALLAGRGFEVVSDDTRVRRKVVITLFALAAALAGAAWLLSESAGARHALGAGYFQQARYGTLVRGVLRSLVHGAAFSAVAALAGVMLMRSQRWGRVLLAGVVTLDLMIAGWAVNRYAERNIFEPAPMVARAKELTGTGRFHSVRVWGERFRLDAPPGWESVVRMRIETLGQYTPAIFGIPTALSDDYDGLAPIRTAQLRERMRDLPWEQRLPILQIAGVRAFSTTQRPAVPGVRLVGEMPSSDRAPHYLYTTDGEPALFVSRSEHVAADKEALDRLIGTPRRDTVVLTGPGPAREGCGTAAVAVVERSVNGARYTVDAPCAGWVRFADAWYPGWKIEVDGRPVAQARANFAFAAVEVAQGRHEIRRWYAPRLPALGLIASLIALALLPAGARLALRARQDPSPEA